MIEDDPDLLDRLADPDYPDGRPEQAVVFTVVAWDVNCPQHITPRFAENDIARAVKPLKDRITDLEAKLLSLGVTP